MSRKKFIESVGAECKNWNWSWSFVNHKENFVIFGHWDIHQDGLILDERWTGHSQKQSQEHINLIQSEGYQLKTFPMQYEETLGGPAKIKSFDPVLENRTLVGHSKRWYAVGTSEYWELPTTEEITESDGYIEGATKKISIDAYERNPKARAKCIEHYGYKCYACKFDFQEVYGNFGSGFIHVHHEKSLAEIKGAYSVDPINDMKPLCPNCHGIVHRIHPPISISELIGMLER